MWGRITGTFGDHTYVHRPTVDGRPVASVFESAAYVGEATIQASAVVAPVTISANANLAASWITGTARVVRRRLVALRDGKVRTPHTARPGELLMFVSGDYRYWRQVDGAEPPVFDATQSDRGVGPGGWTREVVG